MMVKLFFLVLVVTVTMATADGNDGDMMKMVQEMQEEVAQLKAKDEILKEEVLKLKAENEAIRNDKKDLTEEINKVSQKVADLKAENTKMRDQRQMNADSMFLATLSEYENPVADGEAIVWDTAPINPGEHYNTILGMYTAPVNGYYQFTVTKKGNNYFGNFFLLVDEVRYTYKEANFANSFINPASSATINIELTAGQVVRVENYGSTIVYGIYGGGMRSWFTGYLVYAL